MFVIATNISCWLISVVDEAVHALAEESGGHGESDGHDRRRRETSEHSDDTGNGKKLKLNKNVSYKRLR